MLGTLASFLLASRPIHNVCTKHSPAYAFASELVPYLLHLMRERSDPGTGSEGFVFMLDRPHGFNEKHHCDLALLADVTRPASLP